MSGWLQRHVVAIAGGLLVTLAVTLFHLNARVDAPVTWLSEIARQLEAVVYDLRLRLLLDTRDPHQQPVVILDIDEDSLARIGRWPWPRRTVAGMVERLADAGAAVIAFDVVFAEPERNPVLDVLDGTELDPGVANALRARASDLDGDLILARTLETTDTAAVVLGAFLGPEPRGSGQPPTTLTELPTDVRDRTTLMRFPGWTGPPAVLDAAAAVGHVITVPDDLDGVVRRAPLIAQVDGRVTPSLALAAVNTYLFVEHTGIDWADQGPLRLPLGLDLDGMARIPLDERGRVLVPYLGPARTFRYLSAADLLTDALDAADRAALDGAIVFVGTSAIGLFDLRSTPVDRVYPGVEVHATIAEALLDASMVEAGAQSPFPREPDLSHELTAVGLIAGGVLLSLIGPALGPVLLMTMLGVLAGGWVLLSGFAWSRWGLALPTTSPLLLVVAISGLNLLRGFFTEASHRRELRGLFDQYVPPEHIERMIVDGETPTLAGESRVMTVLFADIQGFTSLSEGLAAPELKQALNDFFNPVTRVVLDHQGTVDKYVGDMLMAFWNAPLVDPLHREHGIEAGLAMLREVDRLKQVFNDRGLPALDLGIGLNTGIMNVGDMGSDFRRAYTVIGDAVNLGSRIESLTRRYGVRILVGESTRDQTDEILYRFVDRVQVKGKSEPVRIYEPLGWERDLDAGLVDRVMRYHHAYWLYSARDWDAAARTFDALIEEEPYFLLYRVYRQRIDELRHAELGDDWDGVVVMNEK